MPGAFISFEGIDGSGKSTQLRLLATSLRQLGLDVITTREPGGTSLGSRLRDALLDSREKVDPLAELLVFAADRAQHVNSVLRPGILSERIVLSDRYADATVAYQGAGRGFARELIDEIIQLATGGLKPDLTLIFDIPVDTGLARTQRRTTGHGIADRLDAEGEGFYTLVRNSYLQIAEAEPERVRLINATGPAEETQKQVLHIVKPFLKIRYPHSTVAK